MPSVGLVERQSDVDHGEQREDEGLQERDHQAQAHEDGRHADRHEAQPDAITVWSANMFASRRIASVRMRARSSGSSRTGRRARAGGSGSMRPPISFSKKLGPDELDQVLVLVLRDPDRTCRRPTRSPPRRRWCSRRWSRRRDPGTRPSRFESRMKKNMVPTMGKYLRQSVPCGRWARPASHSTSTSSMLRKRDALVGQHAARRRRDLAPHQHAGEDQQAARRAATPGSPTDGITMLELVMLISSSSSSSASSAGSRLTREPRVPALPGRIVGVECRRVRIDRRAGPPGLDQRRRHDQRQADQQAHRVRAEVERGEPMPITSRPKRRPYTPSQGRCPGSRPRTGTGRRGAGRGS